MIHLYLLALTSTFVISASSQRCFLANGDLDDGSAPCNLLASESPCCSPIDVCLSNGYCYSQQAVTVYRGSCTDSTWKSSACAYYCNDVALSFGPPLYLASGGETSSSFCCGPGYDTVNPGFCAQATHGSNSSFVLDNGHIIYNRTDGSTAPNVTTSNTVAKVATTATVTVSSVAQHSSSNHDVAIGLGVGLPLGILLLLSTSLLWLQMRQRKKLERQVQRQVQGQVDTGREFAQEKSPSLRGDPDLVPKPAEINGQPVSELQADR